MKPVAEAELFGMNTMDDGYAGYNDDNDDYGGGDTFSADPIEDPPSSVKKDTSRRVSFGDDVKGDKKRKVSLKVTYIYI